MKRSSTIAFALVTMLTAPANAADIRLSQFGIEDGQPIYALTIAGYIKGGDDRKVEVTLERALDEGRFPGFVELKSFGGDTAASLRIAAIMHEFGMPVLVRTECTSGCGIIALSAWSGRLFVAEGGKIGLHQSWTCSLPDVVDYDCAKGKAIPSMKATWRVAAALEKFGVPKSVLDRMVSTGPDHMTYLSDDELKRIGALVKR